MTTLRNSRHERFCQLVASGRSQADAYRTVYPASRGWADTSLHPKASELAGKVSARLAELKEAGATKAVMGKVEACEYLTRVVRSPDGEGGGIGSRIAAAGLLAKLMGWYAPERTINMICPIPPDEKVLTILKG